MTDAFRFTPGEVTVKRGETVKFVGVQQRQATSRDGASGTTEELKEHAG